LDLWKTPQRPPKKKPKKKAERVKVLGGGSGQKLGNVNPEKMAGKKGKVPPNPREMGTQA